MPELNRSYIKNLATDETVYGRGLRYYKEKAIKSISKSSKSEHYHAIIQGKSEYQVDIDLSDAEKIKYSCNCPGSFKYQGACKHTIAVLLFICDYQDKNKATGDLPPAKRHIAQVLDYFEGMDNTPTKGDRFKMQVCVNIQVGAVIGFLFLFLSTGKEINIAVACGIDKHVCLHIVKQHIGQDDLFFLEQRLKVGCYGELLDIE